MIFQTLSIQSQHTHALLEFSCLFQFSMIKKIICAIWNLKLSFLSLFSFWDALWLCYQLIIHACSDTDLRKIHLCKIFLSFFLCFSVERPDGLYWCPDRLVVRTALSWSPDGDGAHMSGQDLMESGRALSSSSERSLYIVRMHATSLLLSEAASVRTSSIHRPDGDPTVAIKTHARHIHSLPPQNIWLFVS
jgi:hypothetical protein